MSNSSYITMFLTAFVASYLLSPIIGYIAEKIGIVDLPVQLRAPTDRSKHKVLHDRIVPKSGGLTTIPVFILILIIFVPIDNNIFGLILGLLVILIMGVLDDKYDLSGKVQLFAHLIAAFIVVATGSTLFNTNINWLFQDLQIQSSIIDLFNIGSLEFVIHLPSDLFAIAWIVIMINAIAWVDALDGLLTGISAIIIATIGITSLAIGNFLVASLAFILLGSLLGFLPYNFLPGKAFNGTVGAHSYGYLIAVLALIGNVKSASSILVLLVPFLDMIWVLIGRIVRHTQTNPFKLLSISDKTHLHHRLLDLGLSKLQVILLEYLVVSFFAIIAIYSTGSNRITLVATLGFVCVSLFLAITIFLRLRKRKILKEQKEIKPPEPTENIDESPEKKYAY